MNILGFKGQAVSGDYSALQSQYESSRQQCKQMDTAVFHLILYKNWCNVQFANSYLLSLCNFVYCWAKWRTGSFFVQFLIFLEVNNYLSFSIAWFDLNPHLPSPFNSVKCLPVQFSKNQTLSVLHFFPQGTSLWSLPLSWMDCLCVLHWKSCFVDPMCSWVTCLFW